MTHEVIVPEKSKMDEGHQHMDERDFRRKLKRATLLLTFSLGLPLLALLALVLILLWSARWVDHSTTVIAEANTTERNLFLYQTSFRGYRLSGEQIYLDRIAAAGRLSRSGAALARAFRF